MIEVQNLTKSYGPLRAVNGISFTLEKGEVLGFLGPNGAGKSTTMNMLTGLLLPTEGMIKIVGIDMSEDPKKAKKHLGYLPEIPPLYPDMTVEEFLEFACELKEVKKGKKEEIQRILGLLNIKNVKGRLIKNLSKGYKQRIGIAQALVGNPDVLILDEPTVGLDPKQIREIRDVIKELSQNHTIILSSHILPEVSAVCDRIIIMNKGEIAATDTAENLTKSFETSSTLQVQIEGPIDDVLYTVSSVSGVTSVAPKEQIKENVYEYLIKGAVDLDIRRPLFFTLADSKMPILRMEQKRLSLEDVFLQITTIEETTPEEMHENLVPEEELSHENMDDL